MASSRHIQPLVKSRMPYNSARTDLWRAVRKGRSLPRSLGGAFRNGCYMFRSAIVASAEADWRRIPFQTQLPARSHGLASQWGAIQAESPPHFGRLAAWPLDNLGYTSQRVIASFSDLSGSRRGVYSCPRYPV